MFRRCSCCNTTKMERLLHGPGIPCIFGEENENLDVVESLQREGEDAFVDSADRSSLEEEGREGNAQALNLEAKMPFLQMLQSVGNQPFSEHGSFQLLLRLQHQKTNGKINASNVAQIQAPEPQSWAVEDEQYRQSTNSCAETALSSECKDSQEQPDSIENSSCSCKEENSGAPSPMATERRKRKRMRPPVNKAEIESQRMTHITVERNRRRQMNDHLSALRSLMPPDYVQRGDQASIIGGAIDFVKELEQLLEWLQAQKRIRKAANDIYNGNAHFQCETQQQADNDDCSMEDEERIIGGGIMAQRKSKVADVRARVIQNHVNLKIECEKRGGQLVKAILALEQLRLTVLHLNITSLEASVHYSFSLKIEEDCKLASAVDIAGSVHQIFCLINGR